MKRFIPLLFVVIGLCANSAEVKYVEGSLVDSMNDLWLVGTIERGDAKQFASLLESPPRPNEAIRVHLASSGGDLVEAMKIAQQVRDDFLSTEVSVFPALGKCISSNDMAGGEYRPLLSPEQQKEHCGCFSACFVIWSGGVMRWGKTPDENGVGGTGIHRPSFDPSYFANLSAADAEAKYESMTDNVEKFLDDMGVPMRLVEKMFSIPSGDAYLLSEDDLRELESPPALEEWFTSKCGDVSKELQDRYDITLPIWLSYEIGQVSLSKKEVEAFSATIEEWTAIKSCRAKAMVAEQIARR